MRIHSRHLKLIGVEILCTYSNTQKTTYTLILRYEHRHTGEIYIATQIVKNMQEGILVAEAYRELLK